MNGVGSAKTWRWPSLLAIATAAGLGSALLADGVYDLLSWLVLGTVALVAVLVLCRAEILNNLGKERQ